MSLINLLPDNYLHRRFQRRWTIGCIVLFACVMIAVLSAAAASEQRLARTWADLDNVDHQFVEAHKKLVQMQELQARKAQALAKAKVTASLLEMVPRSTLLAVITNSRPSGVNLTSFSLVTTRIAIADPDASKAAAAKGAKAKKDAQPVPKRVTLGVEVELTGLARTDVQVADFIKKLHASPIIGSVELQISQERQVDGVDGSLREFKVLVELNMGVDAILVAQSLRQASPPIAGREPAAGHRSSGGVGGALKALFGVS